MYIQCAVWTLEVGSNKSTNTFQLCRFFVSFEHKHLNFPLLTFTKQAHPFNFNAFEEDYTFLLFDVTARRLPNIARLIRQSVNITHGGRSDTKQRKRRNKTETNRREWGENVC